LFAPADIPGMIEPVEQSLLTDLAAAADGAIVEFGCFFGRSTACLVNGAARRADGPRPAVTAYDSFACDDGRGFGRFVRGAARTAGLEDLLRRERGRIDFAPVYRHFVGAAERAGLLATVMGELREATWAGGPIGLMHVDAPKFYAEFRYLLFRFFPHLSAGGAVVFQDYFYQWSSGLIAAAQMLAEAGILRFERSAASSALARVLRTPSAEEVLELDLAIGAADVPAVIDRAIAAAPSMALDRPGVFGPRLYLAKLQHQWDAGDFRAAKQTLVDMIQAAGGRFEAPVFADFQELMSYGFSLRQIYELDRNP
jgi:hypothetical protein